MPFVSEFIPGVAIRYAEEETYVWECTAGVLDIALFISVDVKTSLFGFLCTPSASCSILRNPDKISVGIGKFLCTNFLCRMIPSSSVSCWVNRQAFSHKRKARQLNRKAKTTALTSE